MPHSSEAATASLGSATQQERADRRSASVDRSVAVLPATSREANGCRGLSGAATRHKTWLKAP